MACALQAVVFLCGLLPPLLGAQVAPSGGRPTLSCGPHSMQYTLPPSSDNSSLAVSVQDKSGRPRPLCNDTDCGTWVSWRPDGSVVVGANYTGCYVSVQDGEYTLSLEVQQVLEKLKCPLFVDMDPFPAMDAPSPDVCVSVAAVDKLPCGVLPITQAVCQEHGCCYSPTDLTIPCFFGSPVTAHCTADGQGSIAISSTVTMPALSLDSVRLLTVNSTCAGFSVAQNRAFLVFQFPLSCGNSYQVADKTIYENQLEATVQSLSWQGSSITRDSPFRLTVLCTFNTRSSFIPLQVEVYTLPPPLPVSSPGPLNLELRIAEDLSYGSYYALSQYPLLRVLRDPVFVEVRILQRTDPSLVLVLNQCWATPSSDPMQQPQWPILVNRCPFAGDNYRTRLIPVGAASSLLPSQYQRFAVSTFTFVDQSQQNIRGQIYFHCSASVCVPSVQGSCSTVCPSRKRRAAEQWDMERLSLVTAEGPVYFVSSEDKDDLEILEGSHSSTLSPVLFPELVIGSLLAMGGLAVAVIAFGMWSYHCGPGSKMMAVSV